jgi:peptide/nickel transport system substrate-binding protein
MGRHSIRSILSASLAAVLFLSCAWGTDHRKTDQGTHSARGGTLRLGLSSRTFAQEWDPLSGVMMFIELHRCCLLRRLYSYPGLPVEEGGTVVRPDLAAAMPEVSDDGLTWTIEMKRGLRYAPPYEDTEIVAADVIRAFERLARSGTFWCSYFTIVRGFDRFAAGKADTIVGLEATADHTLVVRLTEPAGDLPDRLALVASAPIPAGASRGHEADYIRYLAASGPYMLRGADELDPSLAPSLQQPVTGWTKRSVTLVRNPSWDPTTDDLRPAFPDRILVTVTPVAAPETRVQELLPLLAEGQIDVLMYPPQAVLVRVERGQVPGTVESGTGFREYYIPLRPAVPPFDDVHVRRAVNLVIDRAAVQRVMTSYLRTTVAWHIVPDGLEGSRLPEGWQPSWARGVGARGSLPAARREMARSRYDTDGDGRCDGPDCTVPTAAGYWTNFPKNTEPIARAFARLGIALDSEVLPTEEATAAVDTPSRGYGFSFERGWQADFLNASTYFVPLLYGPSITEEANEATSLIGARPRDLARWGYPVTKVPSIDDRIERCLAMTGEAQTLCWTELDRYTSEKVVPWIPLGVEHFEYVLSSRVAASSFDASVGRPSYDRIVLAPGGGEGTDR